MTVAIGACARVLCGTMSESLKVTEIMKKGISKDRNSNGGFSIIELVTVMAIAAILTAIAVPQMISQRRLTRSTAMTREIMTQMRYARQMAMSQSGATATGTLRRVAFTFQYDDTAKAIKVIGPIPAGTAALLDGAYPNNAGSRVVSSVSLTQGGLASTQISSGIPSGLPGGPTAIDGVTGVTLAGGNLNITFQPEGQVVDSVNNPVDRALFIYNNQASQATASAITVRGASGRVKIWRYNANAANANASGYIE
jgi:prepilin-type N-terminal cleavage/methylation domain-containing protein